MKILKWLLLISCLVNCVLIDVCYWGNRTAETSNSVINNDILGVFEILIIFTNFLFVIWVYFRDEKKENARRYQEKENYWYHDILIQNNIKIVQDLFLICISMSEKADSQKIKAQLRIIKDKKNNVEDVFGYMLKAYKEEIYIQFNEELIKFEDEIIKSFTKLSIDEISKDDYIADVRKCEVNLISILMKHDLKINDN